MKEIGKRTKYYLIQSIFIFVIIAIRLIFGLVMYHKTNKIDKFTIIMFFVLLFLEAYLLVYIIMEFKKRNYKIYISEGHLIYRNLNICLDEIISVKYKTVQHKYFPLRHGKLFIYTNSSRYKIGALAEVKNVCKKVEEEIALNKQNKE